MSNEAFILAEAELLHALGVLLVEAYESSVERELTTNRAFLDPDEELSYNEPTTGIDMFKIPPPPFWSGDESIYTIVPGQIRAAAEKRNITPSMVYGITWMTSLGFTQDKEMDIEMSYYYDGIDSSSEEDDNNDSDEESYYYYSDDSSDDEESYNEREDSEIDMSFDENDSHMDVSVTDGVDNIHMDDISL